MGKSEAEVIKTDQRRKDQKNHLPTRASRGSGPDQIAIGLLYASERSVTITSQKSFITPLISHSVKWDGFITPLISHSVARGGLIYFLPDSSAAHYTADEATCLLWCNVASSRGYKIPQISPLTSARVSMRCHHICMGRKPRY